MKNFACFPSFVFATVVALSAVLAAQPAYAHEKYFRESPSAECANDRILADITKRFRLRAFKIEQRPALRITGYEKVHEHRYIPQDVHAARPIARRYCHATAHFSDGLSRTVWYLIEGGMGFAGYGRSMTGANPHKRRFWGGGPTFHNIEYCVEGMDVWNVYNNNCRLLK